MLPTNVGDTPVVWRQLADQMSALTSKAHSLWSCSRIFRILSLTTVSFSCYAISRIVYLKLFRIYNKLPAGPYGMPLIGDALSLMKPSFVIQSGLQRDVYSIILGPSAHTIVVSNPYLIKQLYSDARTHNIWRGLNKSDAMFNMTNGAEWSTRRKIVYANLMSTMKASFVERAAKAFIINKVFPTFDNAASSGQSIDMKENLRQIGFNIVLQACFGQELESLKDPLFEKFNARMSEFGQNRVLSTAVLFVCGGRNAMSDALLSLFKRPNDVVLRDLQSVVHDFATTQSRKVSCKHDENIKYFHDYITEYQSKPGNAVQLTKEKLKGDMALMLAASMDTTYSAISFSLVLAAQNEKLQQELHEELLSVFGSSDASAFTLAGGALHKLNKLRAFVHEVLRIHPPAMMAGFRNIEDDGVEVAGYRAPKGFKILMNVIAIGQNPKWWIEDYDSELHASVDMNAVHLDFWLDDQGKFNKKDKSAAFLTFSAGKRDCPAQALAMKEIYIVLGMLLIKYQVSGPQGHADFSFKRVAKNLIEPSVTRVTMQLRS